MMECERQKTLSVLKSGVCLLMFSSLADTLPIVDANMKTYFSLNLIESAM
jgi:hypothetical protein